MAPIYKYSYVQNVTDIWRYLGTFWDDFTDKELFNEFWSEMMQVAQRMQKDLYIISLSKTLSTCPVVVNSDYDYFTVTSSGTNATIFLYSGYYYMDLPEHTISISGLYIVNYSGAYSYSSGNNFYYYSTPLVENVDYEFGESTEYQLKLLTTIPDKSIILISGSQKINPVLYKSYGTLVSYDFETWKDKNYVSSVSQVGTGLASMITVDYDSDYWSAVNSKYLIWALTHYERSLPTIENIKDGISIAAGLPFSWYSGVIVDKTATTITVDHGTQYDYQYVQYFRDSSWPNWRSDITLNSGITQFHVLISGVQVYDQFNGSGISYVPGLLPHTYQQNSKLVVVFDNNILINK